MKEKNSTPLEIISKAYLMIIHFNKKFHLETKKYLPTFIVLLCKTRTKTTRRRTTKNVNNLSKRF